MLAEPIRIALRVGRVLDELHVPWIVGGSVASSVHGIPRATQDIDLVADLRARHAEPFARSLEAEFYVDSATIVSAALRRASFNLIELQSMTKVDIFIPAADPLSAAQIARRRYLQVGDAHAVALPVQSPEDVVLQKLRWYEAGKRVSERQWRDVLGVLSVAKGGLDEVYMREQAAAAGLGDLLARALAAPNSD